MILVDDLREYPNAPRGYTKWSHMASDDLTKEGLRELHEMARKIGLDRAWFQDHPAHPHYDLTPGKRFLAVQNGAVEVSSIEYVRRTSRFLIQTASSLANRPAQRSLGKGRGSTQDPRDGRDRQGTQKPYRR
jgi:hypothetical protein